MTHIQLLKNDKDSVKVRKKGEKRETKKCSQRLELIGQEQRENVGVCVRERQKRATNKREKKDIEQIKRECVSTVKCQW